MSLICTHQVSELITKFGWPTSLIRVNLPKKTRNNIYKILLWVLLAQLIMEVLPQEFCMSNYINDISQSRNSNNIIKLQ